jgi:hypothetical protein
MQKSNWEEISSSSVQRWNQTLRNGVGMNQLRARMHPTDGFEASDLLAGVKSIQSTH